MCLFQWFLDQILAVEFTDKSKKSESDTDDSTSEDEDEPPRKRRKEDKVSYIIGLVKVQTPKGNNCI